MSGDQITIYTDGGCHPNPGPGGWGAVILEDGEERRELSGGEERSTNNRMELTAAIRALEAVGEGREVTLYTDSKYLKNGITQWIEGWKRRGWKTAAKEPVKNRDLWQELDRAAASHDVRWRWTRGHAGDRWNERAHELAAEAIPRPELPVDDEDAVHAFLGVAWSGKKREGAWAAVLHYREHQRELQERLRARSPNALHIAGAIHALEALRQPLPVHLYTVSDYLRDGATRWIAGWKRRGWKTVEGKPVANRGWWQRLARVAEPLDVSWHVLESDGERPEAGRAKELAREALRGG